MDDRLLLSEALDAVSRLIRGYANGAQAGKSYLGAIAETLMHYPKSVALACADPYRGVVLQSPEFLPSQGKIIAWCEKRCASMYEEADRDDRIEKQLDAREQWQGETPSERLKAMGKAWLDRSDPIAKEITGRKTIEDNARQAALQSIEKANRKVFERECVHNGVDPAGGVSPSLLQALEHESEL